MELESSIRIRSEHMMIESSFLSRTVWVDLYTSAGVRDQASVDLLLINDGQDLCKMGFDKILDTLCSQDKLFPLVCVGIHAGSDRENEYGTAGIPDYMGRGNKAQAYTQFVLEELVPAISAWYSDHNFKSWSMAGFSLGALSALDIVWHHPRQFTLAGLFSGSFWWRTTDKTDPHYDEMNDRIMHRQIAKGSHHPGLRFFFECGTEDEQEDRNQNGIIDSIDDTLDLIRQLAAIGYDPNKDIRYVEVAGGRHEVVTWAQVMPEFLLWGWGKN